MPRRSQLTTFKWMTALRRPVPGENLKVRFASKEAADKVALAPLARPPPE